MDGERVYREAVALVEKAYADGREAKAGIAAWIAFYNEQRFHQALGHRAPMRVWREAMAVATAGEADQTLAA